MSGPQKRLNRSGGTGSEAKRNNTQQQITALRSLYGIPAAKPLPKSTTERPEYSRREPTYGAEVEARRKSAAQPFVYIIFIGDRAQQEADERRRDRGLGSAIAFSGTEDPAGFRWPAADMVAVRWADTDPNAFEAKLDLARALHRDGILNAQFTHAMAWPNIWHKVREEVADAECARRPRPVP